MHYFLAYFSLIFQTGLGDKLATSANFCVAYENASLEFNTRKNWLLLLV